MTDVPPPGKAEEGVDSPPRVTIDLTRPDVRRAVAPQAGESQARAGATPVVQRPSRWSTPLVVGLLAALLSGATTAVGAELIERTPPPPARVSCLDFYEKVVTLHEKGLEETLRDLPRPEPDCKSASAVLDDLDAPQTPPGTG